MLRGGGSSRCLGAGLGLSKVMLFAAVQAAGGLPVPRVAMAVPKDTQSLQGTDVSSPGVQFSRGQEQHWWIGLHTYENDGRFK